MPSVDRVGEALSVETTYVLLSHIADGLPLYIGEGGPTIDRSKAVEFSAGTDTHHGVPNAVHG